MIKYFIALVPTLLYSLVQVIFKALSTVLKDHPTSSSFRIFGFLFLAAFLVVIAISCWLYTLAHFRLIDIYWITSFSYLLVPLNSSLFLREKVSHGSLFGYLLIVAGSILASGKIFNVR